MSDKATFIRLHKEFLKKHQPKMFQGMAAQGILGDHLQAVGEAAVEMYETIMTQMATRKDLPTDFLERVKVLENIPHVAEEVVLSEIVYQPLPLS